MSEQSVYIVKKLEVIETNNLNKWKMMMPVYSHPWFTVDTDSFLPECGVFLALRF